MLGDICAVPRPCSLVWKEAAQDVEEEEGVDEMFVADERGGFLKSPSRHIIATARCGLSVQPGKETEEGAGDSETTRVGGLGDGCLPDVSSVLASPDLSAHVPSVEVRVRVHELMLVPAGWLEGTGRGRAGGGTVLPLAKKQVRCLVF